MQSKFKTTALCLFFGAVSGFTLMAQGGITPIAGARGAGMGYVGVAFTDVQSALYNQAGLGFLEQTSATVFGEQRFLLADLRSLGAAFAVPTNSGTLALTAGYFGMPEYNEQRIGLGYGRELFPGTSIGAQINMFTSRIPDYGNTLNFNMEIGLQTLLLPKLRLGVHLANPVQTETREGDRMPTSFRAGLGYQTSDKLLVAFELEKDIDFPLRAKTGIEYRPAEQVQLRIGAATQPVAVTMGAGYVLPGGLSFDFAAGYHQVLGLTPSISFTYVKPGK